MILLQQVIKTCMLSKPVLLIFFVASGYYALSHTPSFARQKTDSLLQQLRMTRNDNDRLKLRYELAVHTGTDQVNYWNQLLADAKKNNMMLYECRILKHTGKIYHTHGDHTLSLSVLKQALEIADRNGYKREALELVKMLESIYSMVVNRKQSLYMIYRGMKLSEELNDQKTSVDFYSRLAIYYHTSGEPEKALKILFRMLKTCKKIGYDFGISSALVDIGTVYSDLHQFDKAIPYYLECKKYAPALDQTVYGVQIYTSIANVYELRKQFDSAYYYVGKAYNLASRIRNTRAIASSLTAWGGIDYNAGRNNEAKAHAEKALELAKASHFTAQLPGIFQLLQGVYTREGNHKKALEMYEERIRLRDSLSNEHIRVQAREKEFTYNLEKKAHAYAVLAQQNKIQDLQLRQNQYLLLGLTGGIIIILILIYLFIRQNRFRVEHKRVEMEQKLLRAQMNPHFVFNSLNSIQQLIMKTDNSRAELYLSKFAKLLRDLLESNARDSLTLEEETDLLKAYLEMESLRFGYTFSYQLNVDERINPSSVHIPLLMIQPFVENAIWHGLLPKPDNRNLHISFEYDTPQTIKCTIDDDGIGRAAAGTKESVIQKSPLGLSLVQQRINLIRKTHKIQGSITIIDKNTLAPPSTGTTIVLIVPVLHIKA